MRFIALITAFAVLAEAQRGLDFDMIDAAPDPPVATVPIGAAAATIVSYDANAAAASVSADVKQHPLPQETALAVSTAAAKVKKSLVQRAPCGTQPSGYGTVPDPDTAASFLSSTELSDTANNAATPDGYINTFKNLKASSSAYGYMGFTTLKSYDTKVCASKCDAINGCIAFNLYFERDPTLEPADNCPNPASTNVIKCVFWGGIVNEKNANNRGQWRKKFEVVIAGSNGYVARRSAPQPGFSPAVDLGDGAINAPLDCAGFDTFLGSKIFTNGPFDPKLCAAACTAQSEYNLAHPPKNAPAQTCQFFNTFFVLKNGIPEGQYCSLYSKAWEASYATNKGQWRGNDQYTIFHSFSYTNATDPGKPRIRCDVAGASSAIVTSSLQPYCSSLLGYTVPAVTVTQTIYSTIPSTTVIATVTPLATSTSTKTQLATVTKQLKRDLPLANGPRKARQAREEGRTAELLRATKDANGHFVPVSTTSDSAQSSPDPVARRGDVPAGLAAFPADAVSSACSMLATPVTATATASATTLQTLAKGEAFITTITAPSSTIVTVQTVVSTSTYTNPAAPTVGSLTFNPIVNPGTSVILSSEGFMTDDMSARGQTETFRVDPDGTLYSVTRNIYFRVDPYSSWTALWRADVFWLPDYPYKLFRVTPLGGGKGKLHMKFNGQEFQFCITQPSYWGYFGTGNPVIAYPAGLMVGGCSPVDLIINMA